jgi:hypothetical protein
MKGERADLQKALRAWALSEAAGYAEREGPGAWPSVKSEIRSAVDRSLSPILSELEGLYVFHTLDARLSAALREEWNCAVERKRQQPWTLGGEHGE